MREVLHTACAHFVFDLPAALDTELVERGSGLSEGQAQRIAIARALLRDAPILLLDEFTSALDPETEKRILDNISRFRRDCTIVISAHRPSVLAVCDRIYTIRNGILSELPAAQDTGA